MTKATKINPKTGKSKSIAVIRSQLNSSNTEICVAYTESALYGFYHTPNNAKFPAQSKEIVQAFLTDHPNLKDVELMAEVYPTLNNKPVSELKSANGGNAPFILVCPKNPKETPLSTQLAECEATLLRATLESDDDKNDDKEENEVSSKLQNTLYMTDPDLKQQISVLQTHVKKIEEEISEERKKAEEERKKAEEERKKAEEGRQILKKVPEELNRTKNNRFRLIGRILLDIGREKLIKDLNVQSLGNNDNDKLRILRMAQTKISDLDEPDLRLLFFRNSVRDGGNFAAHSADKKEIADAICSSNYSYSVAKNLKKIFEYVYNESAEKVSLFE